MLQQQSAHSNETAKSDKVYRHFVMFKFQEQATEAQVQEIVEAFGALKNKVDSIVAYEHGTDVSPENLSKGFTHCFLVTFASKKDLEAYLPHPAHQEFVSKLKPILDDVMVVDYWADK